jgi:hypothetical protein
MQDWPSVSTTAQALLPEVMVQGLPEKVPLGQPVHSANKAVPVPVVIWPAGQSRQEVEPGAGWYVETGQEVQAPAEAYLPAGQSAATSSLLPLSSVAASQQESKVIIRRAFNKGLVLACLMDDRDRDLGAELTMQMVTTRRTIAERNLLSMQVISINKQSGVAVVTSAVQALLPKVL